MKSARAEVPASLRADTDFGYVTGLPDARKRLVAYYEYWRESAAHREFVKACRSAGVFKQGIQCRRITRELVFRAIDDDIFPMSVIMLLAECDSFPGKAFPKKKLKWEGQFSPVAVRRLTCLPREYVNSALESLYYLDKRELKALLKQIKGVSMRVIAIPWEFTNAPLAAMFHALLPSLRPRKFPEPKNAGRKGNSVASGVGHMLKQLAVFRLDRAGLDYDSGNGRAFYDSPSAWKRAVRAAKRRIDNLETAPLFGRAS